MFILLIILMLIAHVEFLQSTDFFDPEFIMHVQEYLKRCDQPSSSHPFSYCDPEILNKKLDLHLPQKGEGSEKVLDFIKQYLTYCVPTRSKYFANQAFSQVSTPAMWAEMITALTNTSMYTYEVAPVATLMEQHIVEQLRQLVGFETADGTFTTGGSNGNLIGILCARNAVLESVREHGFIEPSKLVLFCSDQAHYSFEKAASVLGLGTHNVIKIQTDDTGALIPEMLEQAILQSKQEGKVPFFIGATAGTTVLGAIDPLEKAARIAQEYGLWFHVDAAVGGMYLFSQQYRSLLNGIEHANSVTIDFHKICSVPFICSLVLIAGNGKLASISKVGGTEYLFHDDSDKYDLAHFSLQCSRRVEVLKVWLDWLYHGYKGYEEKVNQLFSLAQYAERRIVEYPQLELPYGKPGLPICLQYIPERCRKRSCEFKKEINLFNKLLRDKILKDNCWMINCSQVKDRFVLRIYFLHHNMSNCHVDRCFKYIVKQGEQLEDIMAK